jgi:hypothetical protein
VYREVWSEITEHERAKVPSEALKRQMLVPTYRGLSTRVRRASRCGCPERRRKNLIRLGVNYDKAYAYSRTRKGGWAVAQNPIMGTTITLARLAKQGYESMEGYFQQVSPMYNEPLYMVLSTRVRKYRAKLTYVQWCERRTIGISPMAVYSIRRFISYRTFDAEILRPASMSIIFDSFVHLLKLRVVKIEYHF